MRSDWRSFSKIRFRSMVFKMDFGLNRRVPQSENAAVSHVAVPTSVRRPGPAVPAVLASLDRVFAGRIGGDVRQSSASSRSERAGGAAIGFGILADGVGASDESSTCDEREAEHGRCAYSIEFHCILEPFFWIVALSLKTVKGVILPATVTSPPTMPRPFLTVLDVQLPICVVPRFWIDCRGEQAAILRSKTIFSCYHTS